MKLFYLLLASTLTGCTVQVGGTAADKPSVSAETRPSTTEPPPTRPVTPVTTAKDQYLDEVYANTDLELWMVDSDILELGDLVCDHYDSGGTPESLIKMIYTASVNSDLSESKMMDLAGTAGIAVAILCPEYSDLL